MRSVGSHPEAYLSSFPAAAPIDNALSRSGHRPRRDADLADEEARSLLLRRRKTAGTNVSALTTGEGIMAGLVAGTLVLPCGLIRRWEHRQVETPMLIPPRLNNHPAHQPHLDCPDCPIDQGSRRCFHRFLGRDRPENQVIGCTGRKGDTQAGRIQGVLEGDRTGTHPRHQPCDTGMSLAS